ncbi:hypothetical protein MVES_002862 [Malassezia vespertilionis]|uniref:Uncharacterized protein n=1 Tax=Malassezia vespertilionis TaxID=2020962 RepID=A0A2N1J9C3_9BASI|nr:hypothetical protein MVES_002862 [Malassezia vespertilionis]
MSGLIKPEKLSAAPQFSPLNYAQFFAAGGICATVTHGALTPVDVVKTRLQLEPSGSKMSMREMAKTIVMKDGPSGLLTGFGSTAVGYLIQEFFKKQAIDYFGVQKAKEHRQLVYMGSATAAELIASTLLTPLEASRIRLVSQPSYARGLVDAMQRMWAQEGMGGFYAGYIPILLKQVPFSIGQFYTNEMMHNFVNAYVPKDKLQRAGKTGQITVQLGCGIVAGSVAAILSHPADTLLSKINRGGVGHGSMMSKLGVAAQQTGFVGLWAGLGTRIIMTAALVSSQFLIYDQLKLFFGTPHSIEV